MMTSLFSLVLQKSLEHLGNLDLFNNPCSTDEDEFRKKVFEMLPSLKYLDSADVNNEEADESDLENNGVGGEDDEDDDDDDDLDDEELDDEDDDDEDEENEAGGGGGGSQGGKGKAGATEEGIELASSEEVHIVYLAGLLTIVDLVDYGTPKS